MIPQSIVEPITLGHCETEMYDALSPAFDYGLCKMTPGSRLYVLTDHDPNGPYPEIAQGIAHAIRTFACEHGNELLRYAPGTETSPEDSDKCQADFVMTIVWAVMKDENKWSRRLERGMKPNRIGLMIDAWIALACIHLWNSYKRMPQENPPPPMDEALEKRRAQVDFLMSLLTHDELCWLRKIGDYLPSQSRRDQIEAIVIALYMVDKKSGTDVNKLFAEARLEIFEVT